MSRININILNKIKEVNLKYMVNYSYVQLYSDIHSGSDIIHYSDIQSLLIQYPFEYFAISVRVFWSGSDTCSDIG